MKNYRKYLKATVLMSFLFVQYITYAQCNFDGVCDAGETSATCLDCPIVIPTTNTGVRPSGGNDVCIATKLKTGLACTQYSNDTSTASTIPGKPTCWADVTKDVWFSFIATSQDMTISTDAEIFELLPGTTNRNTELAVYRSTDGTCNNIVEIGCDQDAGINSGLDFTTFASGPTRQALTEKTGLVPGDTYYVRVQGNAGAIGNFCLSVFDTYTVGSKPCEAQVIHPNNMACNKANGNMVVNTTSQGPGGSIVNTIQPGAYVSLGQDYCGGDDETNQYGTWTTFTGDAAGGNITVTNNSGNAVDYTLFSGICTRPTCIESKPVAVGGNVFFSGIVTGTKYYILTTLQGGATTVVVKTDLCITNSAPAVHPPTERNVGGVPGAGGTVNADKCADGIYEITIDQVYKTTTYAADKDGPSTCNYGKNVWFTWKVPAGWPIPGPAFFQMWNKNCATGPGSPGTRLIVQASLLTSDPCTGGCIEFSSPSQTGRAGSSGDIDPYTDAATNVGWDASAYGNQYWGMFQSGNDGVGDEICDFNFMIGSTPSLKGIEIADKTICQGSSVTLTASGGTAYEWWDGSTVNPRTVSPIVSSSYTVTATAGADGYAIGYVTVIPYPFTVNVTPGAICGAGSATLTATSTSTLTTTYTWTPATRLSVTSGPTTLASPTVTTTYTVTGTIGRGGTFPGCSVSVPVTVTNGGSIPVFVNSSTVCAGVGAVLTASGGNTYTWTPTATLSSPTGTTVTATPTAGTTTYSDRNKCSRVL